MFHEAHWPLHFSTAKTIDAFVFHRSWTTYSFGELCIHHEIVHVLLSACQLEFTREYGDHRGCTGNALQAAAAESAVDVLVCFNLSKTKTLVATRDTRPQI